MVLAIDMKKIALLGLFLLGGCESKDPNQLQTEKVKVTVNYKNSPVEGATVSFMLPPTGGSPVGPPAFGITGPDGVASLTTYKKDDGAILGKHMVLITKDELDNSSVAASQDSKEYSPGFVPAPKIKSLLPKMYSLPNNGLEAEVKPGEPLTFSFDLKG